LRPIHDKDKPGLALFFGGAVAADVRYRAAKRGA
jgi:hypothetical protein